MSIIGIILVIVLLGVLCWAVTLLPIAPPFRNLIVAVAVILVILWCLQALGVFTGLPRLRA